jgi:cystathionine beta-synthase/cysteine synthase A
MVRPLLACQTLLDTIGNTPLIKLQRLVTNPLATVLVKLEFMNPSGSIKDRIALHIIDDAERRGLLKEGGTIIENTSGNTGAAVAMIGALRGYRVILTMPDKVSQEKQNALKAYGTEIVVTKTDVSIESSEHYVNKAKQLASEIAGSFRVNQYDNLLNSEAHYLATAPEIWQQSDGHIDYFVAAGSTGGSISGIGKFLKEKNPAIKVIMPDPIGSIYADYFHTGEIPSGGHCNYLLEGIGEDHLPQVMDFSVVDQVVKVSDKQAFDTARQLARREGILAGGSSGANVWAALEIANAVRVPTTIVTLLPDGGIKYLSKCYDDQWMRKNQLL